MNKLVYMCKDVYPKNRKYVPEKTIEQSIEKNRSNKTVSQVRAAMLKNLKWPDDIKILTVKFLGGKKYQKAWVEKVIKEKLEPHIRLKFLFSEKHSEPFITITFNQNKGAYSYVGTECLEKRTIETMNLGWIDPPGDKYGGEFEWQGITYKVPATEGRNGNNVGASVLHEFCHAIGLVHEHQNPQGNEIQWDIDALMDEFSGPPNNWTKEDIIKNVVDKYDEDQLNSTDFDPKSIMLYFYPASVTLDGKGTKANYELSETDIGFLKEQYPPDKTELQVVEGFEIDLINEDVASNNWCEAFMFLLLVILVVVIIRKYITKKKK